LPWYAVFGNHDSFVQGHARARSFHRAVATGGRKVFAPRGVFRLCPSKISSFREFKRTMKNALGSRYARRVPADAARRPLTRRRHVRQYFNSTGTARGHGFAAAPRDPLYRSRAAYYTFDLAPKVKGIVLDTISRARGADGHIDDPQFKWLEEQLKRNSRAYLSGGRRHYNDQAQDKLIVLFSHHTSRSLDARVGRQAGAPYHCFRRFARPHCRRGEALKRLLQRFPNTILWVNGHEHRNRVRAHPVGGSKDVSRGFWEITTSSHLDWPQQSRLIEIAWEPSSTETDPDSVFIYATMVDHIANPRPRPKRQSKVEYLASRARVESYYRSACGCLPEGRPLHRNVKLVIKAPFDMEP
jgi:hypothetical protein